MRPIIEFCITNLASGTQEVLEQLEKDPNLDVIEYACTTNCERCAVESFALVNGEYISGETSEQLLKNIYAYLEENPL